MLEHDTDAVIWSDRPRRVYYVFSATATFLFGILWLVLPTVMAAQYWNEAGSAKLFSLTAAPFLLPFFVIGIAILLVPIFRLLEHPYIYILYTITRSHVLIRKGLFIRKLLNIPLESICAVEVSKGPFSRFLRLANIRINAGVIVGTSAQQYSLVGIPNAEQVARMIDDLRKKTDA